MEIEPIYGNIPKNANVKTSGPQTQSQNQTEAQNRRRSRWYMMLTVLLGLICVLLLVAIIVQHNKLSTERDLMKMSYRNMAEEYNETLSSLKMNYSQLTDEREELQNRFNSMSQKKLELETKVKNLNNALMNKSGLCMYFTSSEEKSWSDSRQFCRDRGQDLVIINTEEEQRYISSIAKDRVWIGLSDIEKEGSMTWVDNTPLKKGFWDKGEPNDDGNEDCVEIISSSQPTLYNWNDLPCSVTRKWICENL